MRHNSRTVSAGIALGVFLVAASPAQTPPPVPAPVKGDGPQPRLVCPEPTFDFGTRPPTKPVDHEFVLRNEGKDTLLITKVKPTCGCTVANWRTKILEPGEETKLKCTLKLKGYRGPQNKGISVHSNDPRNPITMLRLKGYVAVDVEMKPAFLNFSQIHHTAKISRYAILTAVGRAVSITDVTCPLDIFHVDVEDIGGRPARLVVTTKPPLPSGVHRTRITVHTDDKEYPELNVPVVLNVLGEVIALPKILFLPAPPAQGKVNRSILLRPGVASRFKILRVEVPREDIKVTVHSLRAGMQRIELQDIPVTKELQGKEVRIFTDLKTMNVITVPFRVAAP